MGGFTNLRQAMRAPSALDEEEYRLAQSEQAAQELPPEPPGPPQSPEMAQEPAGPYQGGQESLEPQQPAIPLRQALADGVRGPDAQQRPDRQPFDIQQYLGQLNPPGPTLRDEVKPTVKGALKHFGMSMIPGYSELENRYERNKALNQAEQSRASERQWEKGVSLAAPILVYNAKLTMDEQQRDRDEADSRLRYPGASEEFHLNRRNRTPLTGGDNPTPRMAEVTDPITKEKTQVPVFPSPTTGGYVSVNDRRPVRNITHIFDVKQEAGDNPYVQRGKAIEQFGGSQEDARRALIGGTQEHTTMSPMLVDGKPSLIRKHPVTNADEALNPTNRQWEPLALHDIKPIPAQGPGPAIVYMGDPNNPFAPPVPKLVDKGTGATREIAGAGGKLTEGQRKIYDGALDADTRLSVMQKDAADPSGQSDISLLFNHIGMTLGAQKNGRITEAEIRRAITARSLPQGIMAHWDAVSNGQFLSPTQRVEMVKLAHQMRREQWIKARGVAKMNGITAEPPGHPDLPAVNTGNAGTGKSASRALVEKYAAESKITYDEAKRAFQAKGYAIQER